MKRTFLLLTVVALLLCMLPGCGQNAVETNPPTAPAEETSAPAASVPDTPKPTEPIESALLEISEVMPDNRNLVLNHEQDWIELYNPGDQTVRLDGYGLTDDPNLPDALPLAGREISPGGYLAVTLKDDGPFGLSEMGETVYLTYMGETVSQLTFPAVKNGESFDRSGACDYPSPGQANTEDGYREYLNSTALPELIINEVMTANDAYYPIRYGEYYDLVEILNTSERSIELGEYDLTDGWDGTGRYRFPHVTLAPGECYVVLCSGDASLGEKHAPFGLTPGETLYLAKQGRYIDALPIPDDLQHNESYGRSGAIPVYLNEPTPGQSNTDGYISGIGAPTANVEPGLYSEEVTVTLEGEGTIYYTTTGLRPTVYSRVYSEPITVNDVTTIRAFCVKDGRRSPISNFAYVIGKEHDLPVLVVSLPEDSIWGPEGLHTDVKADYEHEAVMTLFEDGEEKFSVPFGLCLHGNDSRLGSKKNYQVRFRAQYGAGKLNYRVFDTRDIDEFNSLLLKGGSEDWGAAMLRDEIATSLVDGTTELYTQAKKPVVLYLAGQYWGIYHIRERLSSDYVAKHLNVPEESVDLLYSGDGYVQEGSDEDFYALKRYVATHDMSTNENYAYLCEQIDVTSLIDWFVCRSYLGDTDTANIRRFRSVEGDGKWRWIFFDLDWSFYEGGGDKPVSTILEDVNGEKRLIQGVLASEAGRDAFFKRYAYLMRTILNEEYINAHMDEIIEPLLSEMPQDRERWKRTMSAWEGRIEELREFPIGREKVVIKDMKDYFSLSDAETEYYFGDWLD